MKRLNILVLLLVTFLLISCGKKTETGSSEETTESAVDGKKKMEFVTIGTGGVTGVYYPTGGAIAKIINTKSKEYKIKVTVQATGGSVFNINAVMKGDLDFGIAQSDRQYQAYKGLAEWKDMPQPRLRSVFSLHAESVTLIASDASGIKEAADMKGKIIAIGNPGSGHRNNALDALWAVGLTVDDIKAEDLKPSECAGTLQDGRIDAYFYTVGHPNGSIKEAVAGTTPVHFVSIPNVDKLLAKYPYYARATIDISHYEGVTNTENASTFGVKATLVTSADVSEETVYIITKELFENFDTFVTLHPAFTGLTKEQMLEGLTAPIHPGALKYYREAGLMQ